MVKAAAFSRLPLAPLPSIGVPDAFLKRQVRWVHPICEVDGRVGHHVALDAEWGRRLQAGAFYYDNGGDPRALSRANKRFHRQVHLASHNRFLIQQLDLVHRSMALMATTSFAAEGRDGVALAEHAAMVAAIEAHDGDAAYAALKTHISKAFETRLRVDAGELKLR